MLALKRKRGATSILEEPFSELCKAHSIHAFLWKKTITHTQSFKMRKMFNLKDRDFKDLETLKGAIKRYFRKQKIGIEAEISEDTLREVFSEAKEKIAEKTDYKVEKIEFPNMFASLL